MSLVIRPAQPADADAVADAHVNAWRVAYRGIVPDAYLDSDEFARVRRDVWQRVLHERPADWDPAGTFTHDLTDRWR
jgi:hypothetical protein